MLPLLSHTILALTLVGPASAAEPGVVKEEAEVASEWRTMVGAEINADSHGALDLGWRRGAWSVELITDTLDVRWQPRWERGRAWAAVRGEFGAAGLMISPWSLGAPVPEASLLASYGGVEGGAVRYLPKGLYAGFDAHARMWAFGETARTDRACLGGESCTGGGVPNPELRLEAAGIFGWWTPHIQGWVRAGSQLAPQTQQALMGLCSTYPAWDPMYDCAIGSTLQPFVQLTAMARHKDWRLAPRIELRAGTASGQDAISRTRIGGLNPYVVPLAGAAWAEFWVESYGAVRAGPSLQWDTFRLDAVVDAAVWSEPLDWGDYGADSEQSGVAETQGVGFALLTRTQPKRWYVDAQGGLAPWLLRQDGVAWSVWLAVGADWGNRASQKSAGGS
jgi:hypothetical protein